MTTPAKMVAVPRPGTVTSVYWVDPRLVDDGAGPAGTVAWTGPPAPDKVPAHTTTVPLAAGLPPIGHRTELGRSQMTVSAHGQAF